MFTNRGLDEIIKKSVENLKVQQTTDSKNGYYGMVFVNAAQAAQTDQVFAAPGFCNFLKGFWNLQGGVAVW
jgi:hypothetical protein